MAQEPEIDQLETADELIAERRAGKVGDTPEDMHPWMRLIVGNVDILNNWVGRLTCLMLVPVIFAMIYEVVARKVFIAPTDWAYDTSRMFSGAMFMMGAGYALMRGVHIRADFLFRNWSPRTQALVDGSLYLLFYFPAMLFFFWVSMEYTIKAWVTWERSMDTALMAPLAPARSAMPIGAFLLLLQGVAEFLRAYHQLGEGAIRRWVLRLLPVYVLILGMIFSNSLFPNFFNFEMIFGDGFDGSIKGLGGVSPPMIGVIMIGVMLFSIFVGFPISFTLIFLAFVFGAWGFGGKMVFYLQTLQFNNVMLEQTLAAVPLFVFMGIMMEQAGLMERLFTSVQLMLSRTRGALYLAVLFVSTIFAAATGIVGASVTILGIMAAKTMNRSGYDVRLAAGTITAGGTLGILIPPSIMLVVMGPVLQIPVTDLFAAAIIPGIMLAGMYAAYALIRCWLNPSLGPTLPEDAQPKTSPYYWLEAVVVIGSIVTFFTLIVMAFSGSLAGMFPFSSLVIPLAWMYLGARWIRDTKPAGFFFSDLWYEFFMGLVPPSALVAFALGSILFGWATPTEGAGCGAFGALVLTIAYRKLTTQMFYDALVKTLEITVLILFLVAASNFFGAVFSRLGTPMLLTEFLLSWDISVTWILLIIMAMIFLLGWPLEWVPIVLIIVPILIPVLIKLDVNLVWFGILVAVNLQTAWLSPPVALSAYFLKGVVPEWDLKDIYFGMMQFMVIQVIGLILIFVFPQIALWLPTLIYGE